MTVHYMVLIREVAGDGESEPFGYIDMTVLPVYGQILTLKWLDGSDAYPVRVIREANEDLEVWVQRIYT